MSLRVYRSVRRLRRIVRLGTQLAQGDLPSPLEALLLARGTGLLTGRLASIIPAVLIALIVADIVKTLLVDRPWESPDDKRRNALKSMYGDMEGEARWQKELIEREISIDLRTRQA